MTNDMIRDGDGQLIRSGSHCYPYAQVADHLYRIDEPTNLRDILSGLKDSWTKLKIKEVEVLPEYGGPNRIQDWRVPNEWTNRVDKAARRSGDLSVYSLCRQRDLRPPSLLLLTTNFFQNAPTYILKASDDRYHDCYCIWDTVSNEIFKIEWSQQVEGLGAVLDILEEPSKKLLPTPMEPICH